jgi:ABC-type uncharacterized transport system substrate-binding protein
MAASPWRRSRASRREIGDQFRASRPFLSAGRILKGAKPADLPVLQPTRFELVINLKAAKTLGLAALGHDVRLIPAQYVKERVNGVVVLPEALFIAQRMKIAQLALTARLPTVFGCRENVDAGGLVSYGPSLRDDFRQAANFVDRILRGMAPSELPVEQPTRIEIVLNFKTAKALGLDVPPRLLARADEVSE